MQLIFGKVSDEHDDTDTFMGVMPNGTVKGHYYKLDVDNEGDGNGSFVITDTIGRTVPFDFEQLDELASLFKLLLDYRNSSKAFNDYWNFQFTAR